MNLMKCLPMCPELPHIDFRDLREIRLRSGQMPLYRTARGDVPGKTTLSQPDLVRAAQALSGHAISIHAPQLAQGFLPLQGGHRLGVCGKMHLEKDGLHLMEISSLCLRIAHAIPGAADDLFPLVRGKSLLILGPPGSGKTTLLRELIRLNSLENRQVAVADERGEIAACYQGTPQLDVGQADVMTLLRKDKAMHILLRTMAPDLLATDELGGQSEIDGVLTARRGGVGVLCTAHASSVETLQKRAGFGKLLRSGVFDMLLLTSSPGGKVQVLPCD